MNNLHCDLGFPVTPNSLGRSRVSGFGPLPAGPRSGAGRGNPTLGVGSIEVSVSLRLGGAEATSWGGSSSSALPSVGEGSWTCFSEVDDGAV